MLEAALSSASSGADEEARSLAAAVGRGEEAAFRQLYDRYQQRLFRFVLVLAHGDEALADDALQATWVTVARKLRRVQNAGHLWNWMAQVARQHLAKAWRQQRRDAPLVPLAQMPEMAGEASSERVLEEHLDAALGALDAEERVVLELFYFEGLSHKEIATQLNLTPKAVSSRLERARARLRALLTRRLSHES